MEAAAVTGWVMFLQVRERGRWMMIRRRKKVGGATSNGNLELYSVPDFTLRC